ESQRAAALIDRSFPRGSGAEATDVIIVRSERYTVASPRFRDLVGGLAAKIRREVGVAGTRTYLGANGASLVSRDRHATLIPVNVTDTSAVDGVIGAIHRVDRKAGFSAAVTGEETRQHDFNQLSQDDLKSGELEFGLPAALIVLMLVFGAVVAG